MAALKREQEDLRSRVHAEVRRLVDSDAAVNELFHMEKPLDASDWERIRRVRRESKEEEEVARGQVSKAA